MYVPKKIARKCLKLTILSKTFRKSWFFCSKYKHVIVETIFLKIKNENHRKCRKNYENLTFVF